MNTLAPSILSADFGKLLADVKQLEQGDCKWLHIDVMDGHFVPNISFGTPIMRSIRPHTDLFFDVHLMIEHPEHYIKDFVSAGAEMIVVHQEACVHLHRVVQQIKDHGVKVGVALNPATPIETLEYVLPMLDMVLIMSVNPGFGGQSFIEATYDKVKAMREMANKLNPALLIQVDGGVNLNNAGALIDCGANVLVAGSAVFKTDDLAQTVRAFNQIIER